MDRYRFSGREPWKGASDRGKIALKSRLFERNRHEAEGASKGVMDQRKKSRYFFIKLTYDLFLTFGNGEASGGV
jgi:hypothetical protein